GIDCGAASQDWNELMRTGATLAKKKEYASAESCFARALALAEHFPQDDPRLITSLSARARCLFLEQKYDLAEALWLRAKDLAARQGNALLQESLLRDLAISYSNQHKIDQAISTYKQLFALKQVPADDRETACDHWQLAELYHAKG